MNEPASAIPSAEALTAVVENERGRHRSKCAVFIACCAFFALTFLALAVPAAVSILAPSVLTLEKTGQTILLSAAGTAGTITGIFFFLLVGATDCLSRLDSSLIAARHMSLAFAKDLFEQAPCTSSKSAIPGLLKGFVGLG